MTDKEAPEGKETPQDSANPGERAIGVPPGHDDVQPAAETPVDAEPLPTADVHPRGTGEATTATSTNQATGTDERGNADDGEGGVGGATAMGRSGVEQEVAAPETSAMPRAEEAPEHVDAAEQARTARLAAIAAAKRPQVAEPGLRSELDAQAQRRNQAREAALTARPVLPRILQVVLAIAFPFILVIGAIKAIASPWFLWLDYHRPGFPLDSFGFTGSERLTYGSYGVDYINNTAPPAYLGGLVDGRGNRLFLETEVAHMEDVKAVIGLTYTAGIILAVAAVLICLYLGRRYAGGIRRGFFAGSVATIVLMAAIAVLGVLNWESFFTDVHRIFFSQGNWTFRMDDTLIRLYPPQFWVDAGITIAALVLLAAIIFLAATWPTPRRRERSRLRQESRDFGLN